MVCHVLKKITQLRGVSCVDFSWALALSNALIVARVCTIVEWRVACVRTPEALDSVNVLQCGQFERFRIESIQAMRRKRFGKFINHCRIFG